jgi:hypothetical protein
MMVTRDKKEQGAEKVERSVMGAQNTDMKN